MNTDIQNFYSKKVVFLTGGSGFLGKAYLEKILRVTDVQRIYVLIRPKKEKDIHERIQNILDDPLFEQLRRSQVDAEKRITPIAGDCSLPNLGLSDSDSGMLVEEVEVVVHSAATVRFNEPLSQAVAINVQATIDLLQLAKKMNKLKAFVHVSTAFSSCTESHIEERYYTHKIGISAENICKLSDILGKDGLNRMEAELCESYPNTYCYTKALAEESVLAMGTELPICIFRPGIVLPSFSEPVAGWADNMNGPLKILMGIAYGVLHVLHTPVKSRANVVPVDFCANIMLACGWSTAKSVRKINDAPPIYNFVPEMKNTFGWRDLSRYWIKCYLQMPYSQIIWLPFLINVDSNFMYELLNLVYHTIPGYIFDLFLLVTGRKRRMVRAYRSMKKQKTLLNFFIMNQWTFCTQNTRQLWHSMSEQDQQLFAFDMLTLDWKQYLQNGQQGMRRYLAKEEPETIPKGIKRFRL